MVDAKVGEEIPKWPSWVVGDAGRVHETYRALDEMISMEVEVKSSGCDVLILLGRLRRTDHIPPPKQSLLNFLQGELRKRAVIVLAVCHESRVAVRLANQLNGIVERQSSIPSRTPMQHRRLQIQDPQSPMPVWRQRQGRQTSSSICIS